MSIGTSSMPFVSWMKPNAKRSTPVTVSTPMRPSSTPTSAMHTPVTGGPPLSADASTSPNVASAKYSGGPKPSAHRANAGPTNVRPTTATVPAMNEPIAAIASAGPARPCFAISCPSMHVMTDAASPGTLSRMDVVEPPYIQPE